MNKLALLLVLVLPTLVRAEYQFTYTNPTYGSSNAPYDLEYFSTLDCLPCRYFEEQVLTHLLDLADAGVLRLVFRDLAPSPAVLSDALHLFCHQEYPDYVVHRESFKRGLKTDTDITLRGKSRERFEQCIVRQAGLPIMKHNLQAFKASGFQGTPSFILNKAGHTTRWSGATTFSAVKDALSALDQETLIF